MKDNLYTIPAHLPFADTLAEWVLAAYAGRPLELSRVLMLLPSRRACLSLRDAFLRVSDGHPLLLPRMQPLGDVDEDALLAGGGWQAAQTPLPPFAFDYKRRFVLARMISQTGKMRMDHALRLAEELAHLLDEMEREQVSLEGLSRLVPDDFAAHWQVTVKFLHILSEHWPRIAAEEGLVSPETSRSLMLRALAEQWKKNPPAHPVIAAGTTGSVPATADLLAVIADLPNGGIVLPGLDLEADGDYFAHLAESHPQWGMKQLLLKLKHERSDVLSIGEVQSPRVQLLSEAMRPAEVSGVWQKITPDMGKALAGLRRIDCAHVQEEADVIALLLRETIEASGKTAALVTHDRSLARRVAAVMHRFGVTLDDSAGIPLGQMPAAVFLRLVLEAIATDFAPLPLLSLLKHPLTHAGLERIVCLDAARELEKRKLRGVLHGTGLVAVDNEMPADVAALLSNLQLLFAPLARLFAAKETPQPLSALIVAHLNCAEALAGAGLWDAPEAEALTAFASELREAAAYADTVTPDAYPAVFEALIAGEVFRPEYGMHPRLKILSPIEARMQSFDRIILGGLNEGNWPPETLADPWFSRPMRLAIGLSAPERRIGLAAHDFMMLASAPDVILTRAQKVEGAPTTPSRWLTRLDALLTRFDANALTEDKRLAAWAALLGTPDAVKPCDRPVPSPPLSARPRQLSVTQVETWLRDPYAIYAAHILRLRALDPLGEDPSSSDFGTAVHEAIERFTREWPESLPEDAYEKLLAHGQDTLLPLFFSPSVKALWWPRFKRIAAWLIEQEHERRPQLARVLAEAEGVLRMEDFILKGRADRIAYGRDGSLSIADYKTGGLPPQRDIEDGLSSQLVLLALIFQNDANISGLEYWQLQGGEEAGKIKSLSTEKIPGYMEAAKEGLARLIRTYDDPAFAYRATPVPGRARRINDYEHLERIKEWG